MLYKIGITEAGDAGIDLSWAGKLSNVDAAVLITKSISQSFIDSALKHMGKLIIHATITGYGHTILEPNVPTLVDESTMVTKIVESGFPIERIVIRVDPIIPTDKGIKTAYHVITSFMKMGFCRYRVSVIDMYPHCRVRFKECGLPLVYGENGFLPSKTQLVQVDDMLKKAKVFWNALDNNKLLRIESCAEKGLRETIACGCISDYDFELLGLKKDAEINTMGYQRKGCMCYAGKTELLSHKTKCSK